MTKRTAAAVMIVGPGGRKWHVDKIGMSPAEAWGSLHDELRPGSGAPLSIVEMRRLGYSCRNVTIAISDEKQR